jgi:hypothetical protein
LCGLSSDANHLNEEPVDADGLQEIRHVFQIADIQAAHRIDQAELKAPCQGLLDAGDTLVVAAFAADAVVDFLARTVQAHTKIIYFIRGHLFQELVKKEAVGVYCDGSISHIPGSPDEEVKVRM